MRTSANSNQPSSDAANREQHRRQVREARAASALLAAGLEQDMLLPAEAVAKAASLSVGHFYFLLGEKKAPAADVRLGLRCVRWRASTVRNWLAGLGAQSDDGGAA